MAGRLGGLGEEREADAAIQEIADKVVNKSSDNLIALLLLGQMYCRGTKWTIFR